MGEMWNKLLRQMGRARRNEQEMELRPYRAVSVVPTRASCPAAVAIRDKRFLVAEAPTLPLPLCTWPTSCPCTLKVYDDRRARPRRQEHDVHVTRERRQTSGRRATDRD